MRAANAEKRRREETYELAYNVIGALQTLADCGVVVRGALAALKRVRRSSYRRQNNGPATYFQAHAEVALFRSSP